MSKNVISYFISFLFSGLVFFCFFTLEYPILYVLWLVSVVIGTAGFIGLGIYAKKNQILNVKTSILWAFNENINDRMRSYLIVFKGILFLVFISMCLIPIKSLVINKCSLLILILLVVLVIEKCISACYEFDDYEIKYNSWEYYLTKSERVIIYKSRVAFFTMGVFPLIVCCLYGNTLLRLIFSFLSFMLPIILGHIYPAFLKRAEK